MIKPCLQRSALLLLCLMTSLSLVACQKKEAAQVKVPPTIVTVAPVVQQAAPVTREFVGETKGSQEAEITAKVEGYLLQKHFTEGRPVKKGQLLYTLDARNLETALSQVKANLAREQATSGEAGREVARLRPLAESHAIAQRDFDRAIASRSETQAALAAARANVRNAEINLSYTRITAPIAGLIGISRVNVGEYVGPNNRVLNKVALIDPIHVKFSLSERDYLALRRHSTAGQAKTNVKIELVLADGQVHPYPGSFVSSEGAVDPTTGSIMIEVGFPNPEKIILPGQFGRVRITAGENRNAILVPQAAVFDLQGNSMAYAFDPKTSTVSVRNLKLGQRFGNSWIVESGLKSGEQVVVEGLQKLKDGHPVTPRPAQPASGN